MSTIRKVPLGRSARAIVASTRAGCAWSWIVSNAVITSKASGRSSVATSQSSNLALVSPHALASVRPAALAEGPEGALVSLGKRGQGRDSAGKGMWGSVVDQPRGVLARQGVGA